jgi:hypothetical protein
MGIDPRHLLLLAIALGVPVAAFLLDRSRWVLAWVGFTLFVQIFDTSIFTNLPAGRLVGLLVLPFSVTLFRRWIRLVPARAWLLNFTYMAALGVVFGFLLPWPDISGTRPFSLRAEGRTIIYLIRIVSDWSLAVFVMHHVTKPGAFEMLRKWMVRGAVVSSVAAFTSMLLRFDFYYAITGLRAYAATTDRPRGLTFEARGLGLACAYGVVLILGKQRRRPHEWLLLLVIVGGLAVSSSTSGLAAALAGLIVVMTIGSGRVRAGMIAAAILVLLAGAAVLSLSPTIMDRPQREMEMRLKGRGVVEANRPANLAESLALRLDVFDSSAALFLLRNPRYALTGTGPGLISLPASEHVPLGLYKIVFPIIDNPPSHGVLLELANTGVLGLTAWLFQVAAIFVLGRRLRGRYGLPFQPKAATTIFMAAAALYSVQVSPSPFWAVFLGVGWGIAQVATAPAGVSPRRARASERQVGEPPDGQGLVVEPTVAFRTPLVDGGDGRGK